LISISKRPFPWEDPKNFAFDAVDAVWLPTKSHRQWLQGRQGMHPIPQDTKHPKKEKKCRFNKQEEEETFGNLWKL